jgi:hypothetical protein
MASSQSALMNLPNGFDQRLFQAQETVDMFVEVPAFDAQFALIDRMGFHRQGAVDFTVDHFKKDAAAGSAVRTDRGDKFAIHISSPLVALSYSL